MKHETTKHYSQEAALFEGFLDPYMKYSSGWYETWDESLDVAIVQMLDKILDNAGVRDGCRVLEIGNGWGSLIKRLRERFSDVEYVGVNPSQVQLDWIADNVDTTGAMVKGAHEDVMGDLEGPFDAIFMIGALCHMKDKQAVMKRNAELLADDGRIIVEDTFFLSEALYQKHAARQETKYVQDTIFGYAHVYSLARHFDELRNAGLQVIQLDVNSDDYAKTIDFWTERIKTFDVENYPLAPHFVAYMDVFQRGWHHTICNHLQTIAKLPKRRRAKVAIPGS